ncbi:hypothetical protein DFH06DRAFT_1126914 [Mycena polygramma]|nr:hypothetical protein DFH06DRAFT_1150641 [Mycena polygramma]KAJ7633802.1 hypothetical protein DFH06DRAFT_1139731 [Mycena polygramma]KAJ7666866.1 hypothetical protein DFH06DRAFT_1126914 [Mycena polygramma]
MALDAPRTMQLPAAILESEYDPMDVVVGSSHDMVTRRKRKELNDPRDAVDLAIDGPPPAQRLRLDTLPPQALRIHPSNVDAMEAFRARRTAASANRAAASANKAAVLGSSLSRTVSDGMYGPDFSRNFVGFRNFGLSPMYGMLNSYHLRDSGDPFVPLLVGIVKRGGGSNAPLDICLSIPPVSAGHPIDVLCWDQLQMLRRVMDTECADTTHSLWDADRKISIPCVLGGVVPWSTGPLSDTDNVQDGNCIYIHVPQACDVVHSTPGRLFSTLRSEMSRSVSSTLDNTPPARTINEGDLVAISCTLHCDHRAERSGAYPQGFIRSYRLVATKVSVIV